MNKKNIENNFAVFILTNKRPNNVRTYATIRKSGYTGKIFLVLDDLDDTREEYIKKYGEEVVIFNKKEAAKLFDVGDNFGGFRGVVYARNAIFGVAKKLDIKYFMVLDDDYVEFQYRFDENLDYAYKRIKNLDDVFKSMLKFFIASGCYSIAMAQGGDYIGGSEGPYAQKPFLKRKCMNSFICDAHKPFEFTGRINEDVNAYINLGMLGGLIFTTNQVSLKQLTTQANSGGLTELYLDSGTYVKSFYSVLYQPSAVKVKMMHTDHSRLHHAIKWNNVTPMILREDIKKS